MRTLAVIVTHNRSKLLSRCLDSLESQTRKPDDILVVNNGSTDNTQELLRSRRINFIEQSNVGSAGGWYSGIKYANENKFDLCWLMDDDGFPDINALNLLLQEFTNDNYVCLSSIVLNESDNDKLVFPIPILNKNLNPTLRPWGRKLFNLQQLSSSTSVYQYAHLFNGALISLNAVKDIGNVNKGYFIMGDEVDYFYRLREIGKVGTLIKAKHYHPDVSKRAYSRDKIYYLLKNTIINHNLHFDYPLIRNFALLFMLMIRVVSRNGIWYFIKLILSKDLLIFRAIRRGLSGSIHRDSV